MSGPEANAGESPIVGSNESATRSTGDERMRWRGFWGRLVIAVVLARGSSLADVWGARAIWLDVEEFEGEVSAACTACGDCLEACPYGAIFLGQGDRVARKCDLCGERLKYGLEPACVRVCPTRALACGSPNELGASVSRRAARRLADEGEKS